MDVVSFGLADYATIVAINMGVLVLCAIALFYFSPR